VMRARKELQGSCLRRHREKRPRKGLFSASVDVFEPLDGWYGQRSSASRCGGRPDLGPAGRFRDRCRLGPLHPLA
jgi:hypothetical protein